MKKALRVSLQEKRNEVHQKKEPDASLQMANILGEFCKQKNIDEIFCYWAFRSEPNILDALIKTNHSLKFYLPRIENNLLNFYAFSKKTTLIKNKFGINEPSAKDQANKVPSSKSLVIAPALAIGEDGTRLGYGGGFYDRFFKHHPKCLKIACIYSDFYPIQLPKDPWDQPINGVLTEKTLKTFT